jgi:hypothetical protein
MTYLLVMLLLFHVQPAFYIANGPLEFSWITF